MALSQKDPGFGLSLDSGLGIFYNSFASLLMIIVSEIGNEIYFSLDFFISKCRVLYLIFVKNLRFLYQFWEILFNESNFDSFFCLL